MTLRKMLMKELKKWKSSQKDLLISKESSTLKKCTNVAVRYCIESESMSKSWTQSAKTTRPRELIYALRKPGVETENPYEKNLMKMAELARDYHENLQKHDIAVGTVEREDFINSSLAMIQVRLMPYQKENLGRNITEKEVKNALKQSKNNKSPGLDGVTYELWKTIHARHCGNLNKGPESESFDILKLLTACFNNIENYGIVKSTNFAERWMCPIYKKK